MKEGQDVMFKASLTDSSQQIICHVSCEEIGMFITFQFPCTVTPLTKEVGTSKSVQIELDIDPTLFSSQRQKVQQILPYKSIKPGATQLSGDKHYGKPSTNKVPTTTILKEGQVKPWKAPSWTSLDAQVRTDNDEYDDFGLEEACKLSLEFYSSFFFLH